MRKRLHRWIVTFDNWKHREAFLVLVVACGTLVVFATYLALELQTPTGPYNAYLWIGWMVGPIAAIFMTGPRMRYAGFVRVVLSGVVAVAMVLVGSTFTMDPEFAAAVFFALAGPVFGILRATTIDRRVTADAVERRHTEMLAELGARLTAAEMEATHRHAEVLDALRRSRRRWWFRG